MYAYVKRIEDWLEDECFSRKSLSWFTNKWKIIKIFKKLLIKIIKKIVREKFNAICMQFLFSAG